MGDFSNFPHIFKFSRPKNVVFWDSKLGETLCVIKWPFCPLCISTPPPSPHPYRGSSFVKVFPCHLLHHHNLVNVSYYYLIHSCTRKNPPLLHCKYISDLFYPGADYFKAWFVCCTNLPLPPLRRVVFVLCREFTKPGTLHCARYILPKLFFLYIFQYPTCSPEYLCKN